MLGETWKDQYRRLHRSFDRLKRAVDQYIERDLDLHDEANARDILYHFCSDALHLRDYIEHDKSTGLSKSIRGDVWNLFDFGNKPDASKALATCRDIANGFKHLDVTRSKFSKPAEVVKQEAGITIPCKLPAYFTYHFIIKADRDTYTELELANRAIADWNTWLTTKHHLRLPT